MWHPAVMHAFNVQGCTGSRSGPATTWLSCRGEQSMMQHLHRVTGAVCLECGQQHKALKELRTHAQHAHNREICKTCVQSGRFFGQELLLRSVQEHSVRSRLVLYSCSSCCKAAQGTCQTFVHGGACCRHIANVQPCHDWLHEGPLYHFVTCALPCCSLCDRTIERSEDACRHTSRSTTLPASSAPPATSTPTPSTST